jgi:2-methylcitrate dehydratase
MDKTADRLADYASRLGHADITPQVLHAAKRSLVDSFGCAYGAFDAEPVKAVRTLASDVSAKHPATILGTSTKSSPEWAAFANAAMIRYLDFSDDCFGPNGDSGPHPSDNIGAVLASAEAIGRSGREFLLGMVLAYEVCGQLVQNVVLRVRGWDYPVFHAIASAVGAAKMLGLTREQMRHALALSIVPNIALSQTRHGLLSNWKGLAGPNGSRGGLIASLIAKQGITGPVEPFEGKGGFMRQLDNTFELAALGGEGVPFRIESTCFKCLPIKYGSQLPVWVALELRKKVKIEDVESICCHIIKRQAESRDKSPQYWDPTTRETADHSTPYLIAAAMIDGEVTEKTLTPARFRDPTILALVQKISMQPEESYAADFPRTFQCRLETTLKSGEVVSVYQVNPRGHYSNPMSDAELEQKFLSQTEGVLPSAQARALLDQLWNVDKLDDLGKLFALAVVPGAAGR